jgi:hypothetical protein
MTKYHLGPQGQRLKWNLYFAGIVLLIVLATCRILSWIDWSTFQRTEFEKHLREIEEKIVLEETDPKQKARRLLGQLNMLLRKRWQTAYVYSEITGEGIYIGRPTPPAFRKAVEKQRQQIDAGLPFDKKSIPDLRLYIELERLKVRMLVADAPPLYEQSR